MTIRLYYDEPSRATFDATVTSCVTRNGAIEVMLDQTAFYPTSGGQPHDLGRLSGARVLDVVDTESEEIVHVVDAGSPRVRAFVVRSTGSGGSITCNSIPGSTCCRRPSIECSGSALKASILASRRRRSTWRARYRWRKCEGPRTRPIASCGRIGRLRSGLPRPRRLRIFPSGRLRCGLARSVSSRCAISISPHVVAPMSHALAPSVSLRLREPISFVGARESSSCAVAGSSPGFANGGRR